MYLIRKGLGGRKTQQLCWEFNEKICKKHDYDLRFTLVSILRFFSSDNITWWRRIHTLKRLLILLLDWTGSNMSWRLQYLYRNHFPCKEARIENWTVWQHLGLLSSHKENLKTTLRTDNYENKYTLSNEFWGIFLFFLLTTKVAAFTSIIFKRF